MAFLLSNAAYLLDMIPDHLLRSRPAAPIISSSRCAAGTGKDDPALPHRTRSPLPCSDALPKLMQAPPSPEYHPSSILH